MPRRNNLKKEPQSREASIFDTGYKAKCYGCAFAGPGFACQTSDGECLKLPSAGKEVSDGAVQ